MRPFTPQSLRRVKTLPTQPEFEPCTGCERLKPCRTVESLGEGDVRTPAEVLGVSSLKNDARYISVSFKPATSASVPIRYSFHWRRTLVKKGKPVPLASSSSAVESAGP